MSEESKPKNGNHSRMDGATIAWIVVVVVVTAIVSWFAFAAAYGVGVGSGNGNSSSSSGNSGGTTGGGGPDYVYLSINANPDISPPSADQYNPANFTVPAHTLLVFVITNYDTGENPVAPTLANVAGTVGNVEYLNGSTTGVSSVPASQVSHTFSFVGKNVYSGFNAPIPAASNSTPTVVMFHAYFNTTGAFVWHCLAPCDSWSMGSPGYMIGTMTVVG